ncbi:ExbD/TolR family protein [Agarilytica rhodophyticola]|uniref:ExbD/TolR family protein n=1 Tax=Agarilytica rhodophyticola TaxID=1737490 RepID=UPI000B341CC0|nr:biopolymer transporter ExbD [Agarilytica rhodophyticola]
MSFKRQVSAEEGINLTPLIDVVFLLLIFFMVSTTFTKESHLQIDLPEATGEASPQRPEQLNVVVDAEGGYSVNGKKLINSQLDTLRRALSDASGGETKIPFVITGDAASSYQSIISVMDTAGQMGFVNISMTTRTPQSAEGSGSETQ